MQSAAISGYEIFFIFRGLRFCDAEETLQNLWYKLINPRDGCLVLTTSEEEAYILYMFIGTHKRMGRACREGKIDLLSI